MVRPKNDKVYHVTHPLAGTIRRAYLDGMSAECIAKELDMDAGVVNRITHDLVLGERRDLHVWLAFKEGSSIETIAVNFDLTIQAVARVIKRAQFKENRK